MDANTLIDGLIQYLGLVVLLTFHEFGHAWMASKCGDDTARMLGRVSLNPLVHIDPIGTVLMPILMIFLPHNYSRFIVGWAKPVPVNVSRLRNRQWDDILVTLAGPWMNLLLGVVFMGLARVGLLAHSADMADVCKDMSHLSLLLCFFNLLPIPPLDGSRVVRVLIGMTYETYYQISRYGFLLLIAVINIPAVQNVIQTMTDRTFVVIAHWFGMGF